MPRKKVRKEAKEAAEKAEKAPKKAPKKAPEAKNKRFVVGGAVRAEKGVMQGKKAKFQPV